MEVAFPDPLDCGRRDKLPHRILVHGLDILSKLESNGDVIQEHSDRSHVVELVAIRNEETEMAHEVLNVS